MKKLVNLVWNLTPENFDDGKVPEDFKGELDETIKSFSRYTTQLLDKLRKATQPISIPISYQEIAEQIKKIKAELETNAPYFLEVFDQSLDRMIRKVKQELGAIQYDHNNRTNNEPNRPAGDEGKDREEVSKETTEIQPAGTST